MVKQFMELSNREKFIISRWCYSIGEPIISDAEYTMLLNYMQTCEPDDEYVHRSWSSDPCPIELLNAIGRPDLIKNIILSDKTESIPSLGSELKVQEELRNFLGEGTLSMKHDGWNMQANYYNGKLVNIMTRGRSCDAFSADPLLNHVPAEIPAMGKVKIVNEATVSHANFAFCASMFGNVSERSAVSSILARPEYTHLISLHAFDIHGYDLQGRCKFDVLQEWGFDVPKYYKVTCYQEILDCLKMLSDENAGYQWPTDGAVFDGDKRRAIRLLAWQEPIYHSYVTGYLEQYNMFRISPSLLIYPVLRKGTTQRRVNITNWQRIMDYDLQPGSPVAFRVASSAVADFDETSTRLLQQEWNGKWDEYAKQVHDEEEVKKLAWQSYLNT